METAVFVGGGLGVNVDAGGIKTGGALVRVAVGINNVLDAVGDEVKVRVAVGLAVFVGVDVEVGINSTNDCAVSAATVFRFEKARSAISPASMTMGVGKLGSDKATAEVAQNIPNPRMLAPNIHRRLI